MILNGEDRSLEYKTYLKEVLQDITNKVDDIIDDLINNSGCGGVITIQLPMCDSPIPTYEVKTEYYSKTTFDRLCKGNGVK